MSNSVRILHLRHDGAKPVKCSHPYNPWLVRFTATLENGQTVPYPRTARLKRDAQAFVDRINSGDLPNISAEYLADGSLFGFSESFTFGVRA